MSLIFFDCEFTGLRKNTELISIGLVSDKNLTFYAEFNDYSDKYIDKWIKENVIENLKFNEFQSTKKHSTSSGNVYIKGNKNEIRAALIEWLNQFEEIDFVSDVCHYDFVLLIDLLYDCALNMPSHISPICHDINNDIAEGYDISIREAFDKSREDILHEYNYCTDITTNKHNSLYDALVIKAIFELFRRFEFI